MRSTYSTGPVATTPAVFVVTHHGRDEHGEVKGTGVTFTVVSQALLGDGTRARAARMQVATYLLSKKGHGSQLQHPDLVEVQKLEDSAFCDDSEIAAIIAEREGRTGVVAELYFAPDDELGLVVFSATAEPGAEGEHLFRINAKRQQLLFDDPPPDGHLYHRFSLNAGDICVRPELETVIKTIELAGRFAPDANYGEHHAMLNCYCSRDAWQDFRDREEGKCCLHWQTRYQLELPAGEAEGPDWLRLRDIVAQAQSRSAASNAD